MAKGVFVVMAKCTVPDREDEWNKWYEEQHAPDALVVPGFVSARRYKLIDKPDTGEAQYLCIYEIEADDLQQVVDERRRSLPRRVELQRELDRMFDDGGPGGGMEVIHVATYEELSEPITKKGTPY